MNEITGVQPTYYNINSTNTSTIYEFPSSFQPFWADFDQTTQVALVSGQEGSEYLIRMVNVTTGLPSSLFLFCLRSIVI